MFITTPGFILHFSSSCNLKHLLCGTILLPEIFKISKNLQKIFNSCGKIQNDFQNLLKKSQENHAFHKIWLQNHGRLSKPIFWESRGVFVKIIKNFKNLCRWLVIFWKYLKKITKADELALCNTAAHTVRFQL